MFIVFNLVFYRLFCLIFSDGEGLRALIGTNFVQIVAADEGKGKKISLQDLALFPAFLRFREVDLRYYYGSQSIAEKCDLFDKCLQSIKPALNDSYLIYFNCFISKNKQKQFSNHQTLIKYISERLLPICESSRKYSFSIWFDSDVNSASNVIASILQMAQIIRYGCFSVCIELRNANLAQLPIETISTWLNRNSDAMEIHQKQTDRVLLIRSDRPSETFQNIPEICAFLKMVNFNLF